MKQPKANWASGENMLHEGCVGQWFPKSVMENQIRTWQRRIDHDRSTWKPRTPNTYRNPKSLDLARSKRHGDILCWSFLVFADLFWSFASNSETLFHHSPAAFSFANSCHVRSRPRVDAWMDCCLDSWSIKALSAEGNKEINGNDTSVNSTWITQHPNTCILQNHTVHVQAWMCNLCSDTPPCLLSPGQCILFSCGSSAWGAA